MWLGTADGLDRYDGYEIKTYRAGSSSFSPEDNTIQGLHVSRTGELWIATSSGLARFDYAKNALIHRTDIPNDSGTTSGPWQICEDASGNLWVGVFGRGLFQINSSGNVIAEYRYRQDDSNGLPSKNITALAIDKHGLIWIGTLDRGVTTFNPATRKFKHFRPVFGGWGLMVTTLCFDRAGILWVGTNDHGLYRYDESTGLVRHYRYDPSNPAGIASNNVTHLLEDHDGNMWIGSFDAGLSRLNKNGTTFIKFRNNPYDPQSLSSNSVIALFEDEAENLWVGTRTVGVDRLDLKRPKFTAITNKPGKPRIFSKDFVWRLLCDRNGFVWVSTGDLQRISPGLGHVQTFKSLASIGQSTSTSPVSTIAEDPRGFLWFTTPGYLNSVTFEGHPLHMYPIGRSHESSLADAEAFTSIMGADGSLRLGLRSGAVAHFDPLREVFSRILPHGNLDSTGNSGIAALQEDDQGNLWIGTARGLFAYSPLDGKFRSFRHDPSDSNSVSNDVITSICLGSNRDLWVGTVRGLNRIDRERKKFQRYFENDGLANDKIWAVLADDHGGVWASTNKGISHIVAESNSRATVQNYGLADGLPCNEFNLGSAFKDSRTGDLFFGGTNGFVRFHPDSLYVNPFPPPIALTGFKLFDEEELLDTSITVRSTIVLRYDQSVFSFRFAALDFTLPERNRYAYMMEGFENTWVYSGSRREVRYTNLNAGEYVFRVKACNNDGVWNQSGLAMRISIVPPFWRTTWFVALAVIIVFGTIGGSIRYIEMRKLKRKIERLEHEQALERERSRISKDMHDDVGANLTKISIMSELAMKSHDPSSTRKQLKNISQTSREVVDNIGNIVWAINPKNDRLENLVGYVREFVSDYFEGTKITCEFEFPEELPGLALSAELRRNLFLTIKEAIHNVVKHSSASEVAIKLEVHKSTLQLSLRDNGRGFDPLRKKSSGNGLQNMRKRIEEIGGTFDLQSKIGNGTNIHITISKL